MRTSHRLHLGLPFELKAAIDAFARAHGLGLGAAVRLLAGRSLSSEAQASAVDPRLALATLTAAEHAVLMVASILPEGERRMRELGQQATLAAEERLSLFTSTPEAEQ